MQKLLLITFFVSLTCGILYFSKAKNGAKIEDKTVTEQVKKVSDYDVDQDDSEDSIYGQSTEEEDEEEI